MFCRRRGGARIADQPYRAERAAEPGIGAAHQDPAPTVESLTAALAAALSPETGARAQLLWDTVSAPSRPPA
ncbi:hypothetical protein [Amycolatopsis roodepoortensis]|uniref:hypothetical protein n=1 Tax=Amycolatopsis roodepoortensis TaxID=700274 RepID=UPI003531088C